MFDRLLFQCLSETNQINTLRDRAKLISIHNYNGRKGYLYQLKDLFVEVIFYNDNSELPPEKVKTFTSMEAIERYLQRQSRPSVSQ